MSRPTDRTPGPVRLAVVDDHELVVAGVRAMLAPYADRVQVVDADLAAPSTSGVDLLLVDRLARVADALEPGEAGGPRMVVYSWDLEPRLVREAVVAGAGGYLSKGLRANVLVAALEQVHAGIVVVPEAALTWPGRAEGLSAREAQTITEITQGFSNQEIADHAGLSINSVKTYIRSAYRKIGVQRRAQAVLWGLQHDLTGPDAGCTTGDPRGHDLTRRAPSHEDS